MRLKIRGKLLLLLLALALLSLGAGALLNYVSLSRLGRHLAIQIHETLANNAHSHLRSLVEDFGRLQQRDRAALELMLLLQAQEVEHRLSAPAPTWKPSAEYEQGFFAVPGAPAAAVADARVRLATLAIAYQRLEMFSPQSVIRRLVALESGFEAAYPKRDYPSDYDPRRQPWYREAQRAGTSVWAVMPAPATQEPIMVAARPVHGEDGVFAGVTAIEISLSGWFEALRLPEQWLEEAEKLLVVLDGTAFDGLENRLRIVAEEPAKSRPNEARRFSLKTDDPTEMEVLLQDIRAGRAGERLVGYGGRETHWVYGAWEDGQPFPVIIVPHERIIAKASEFRKHVQDRLAAGLWITGLLLMGVVFLVGFLAVFSARRVTRPLSRLAGAAERLAAGDYGASVEIRTGDEIQDLGDIFNTLGPRLRERERMARSLAAAREIQQRLLPHSLPQVPGFDIAGRSIFCDETGGDYFDFIELAGGRLGLAVGDVSGHGIGAALIMTAARGVLRSYAALEGGDPGTLFGALNRHLIRDIGDQEFMTLFYAELDPGARSLRWNSAGQGPVFLYRGVTGKVEELPTTGIPLGILAEETWDPAGPIALERGDILLVGTDGLWETCNPEGEMLGTGRLCEILAAHANDSAAELCAAVMERALDFRGDGRPEDDLTLVVVRVAGR